jgi:ATP-binding cassette subfamily F protein uup
VAATPPPRRDKPVPRDTQAASRRLGFKRERALIELPKKIDTLHAEMAGLNIRLADPDLYRRDPAAFQAGTARLSAAQAELDAAETEWLELEMLKEELKSAG